jgi:hypothetical protein
MANRRVLGGQANPHAAAWADTLSRYQTTEVDLIGSINEDGINYILNKHYQFDKQRYTLNLQRQFNVNGVLRTFTVTLTANNAFTITLPPYTAIPPATPLMPLDPVPASSKLTYPPIPPPTATKSKSKNTPTPPPNIQVYCPSVTFTLTWPKLDGTLPNWSFTSNPFSILAEALVELNVTSSGAVVNLQLVSASFEPTIPSLQNKAFKRFFEGLSESDRALVGDDDQAFQDLLLIVLNIAADIYAPKMVYDINIPVITLAGVPIYASLLDVTQKTVVVGASVNRPSLSTSSTASIQRKIQTYLGLLDQDIANAGGMEGLVVKTRRRRGSKHEEILFRSAKEINSMLPLSSAYLSSIKVALKPVKKTATPQADVPGALALGADQLFLTRVVTSIIPSPSNYCSAWATLLDTLRGRICYWVIFSDPEVTIAGTSVSGDVGVDIGGAIDGCVRKFWDCSFQWDCNSLSLAIVGRPGIDLYFDTGSGVSFKGKITGSVQLDSNLPFPFGNIVDFFGTTIANAIIGIVNAVVSAIQFDILLPTFQLPEQNTVLEFEDVSPFPFTRSVPATLPADEQTFIGFLIGLSAKHK